MHVLLGGTGLVALANLQVVDAAVSSVIKQANIDLVTILDGSDQLRVQHIEGTVAAHCVYFLIRASDLAAVSACNFVTHAVPAGRPAGNQLHQHRWNPERYGC